MPQSCVNIRQSLGTTNECRYIPIVQNHKTAARQVLYISPQLTQALYPVYREATLYSVYILSVYTVHCIANVILNYIKSFNMLLN